MAHDKGYRNAELKIADAWHSGSKKLDLSVTVENGENLYLLTKLPDSIRKLTQVQSLDLRRNQLTDIPEWLGQLTSLRSLNLSLNKLTTLPESLGNLTQLRRLNLSFNQLVALPVSLGNLTQLQSLDITNNQLTSLPEWLMQFRQLQSLKISSNKLTILPKWLGRLNQLQEIAIGGQQLEVVPQWIANLINLKILNLGGYPISLSREGIQIKGRLTILPDFLCELIHLTDFDVAGNQISEIPSSLSKLKHIEKLDIAYNNLTDLPASLAQLEHLEAIQLANNPLNPELAIAFEQGTEAIKTYLRAKTDSIILYEAKLILIGEGEVGKSCLLGALRGDAWEEGRPTTHGIKIKPVNVTDPDTETEITLNGWDFGGQRVYRPTHQLFFSAPAVYLVVWKPREGPQQGFVKEWIQLVKRREPEAKILVVATHGGPQQRQPDIDRQELWDLFGVDTVIEFFHVESKPDNKGDRRDIEELKHAIARVAASLPEVGRSVPKSFQKTWQTLQNTGAAYLSLERVLALCRKHQMDDKLARLFVTISHRLGHLIHYEHDPALRDIVVLKPDWLATAISYVLDDEATRKAHGLVRLSHLNQLWDDPSRATDSRYPATFHPIFLRLMERFDLSYRVADPYSKSDSDPLSLIAQLVPDNRPEKDLAREWAPSPSTGDIQQVQICRIVDDKGQSATAEGLFYQLIVRLHKYSLGRVNYCDSVHWQRGLVLDDDYNGRALLEHVGNDVRITVRAPYPERFLAMLTEEVKYLVESFWEGLRCDVMVPCINPCGKGEPGTGLFEVEKLITFKRQGMSVFPCMVSGCNQAQDINLLLRNAPAIRSVVTENLFSEFIEVKQELEKVRQQLTYQGEKTMGRFNRLDDRTRRILSRVDNAYTGLIQALTDEAKEGPRLFSFEPVDRSGFNPKQWTRAKFRLTLWCEHSKLPLPVLIGKNSKAGVYEIELTRVWFKKAAPFLKVLTGTLSLVLPIASSGIKLALDDTAYNAIEEQLDFGKDVIDASLSGSEKVGDWLGGGDSVALEHGEAIRAQGATLREFHALLKAKDPGFGGLVRVMNKRQEFLWVHPQFEKEY